MSEARTQARKAPDLRPLEAKYEILSEVRDGDDLSTYVARNRADGGEVEIAVVRRPRSADGDNNALAHFASDTQLLSTLSHAAVPRVLGGQWLGTDAFAVVRERVQGTSLSEQQSTDDGLANTRIAAVLQEVNGVLTWAREAGVVHRGVTPTTLFFEQRTNRVRMSLAPTPIPIEGVPDAGADARTIGMLAWRMLTGETFVAETAEAQLPELTPDLAARVRTELLAVARSKNGTAVADVDNAVNSMIASIAMADALKQGEIEAAKLRAEVIESQRIEREKWAVEQRECELRNAEQKQAFADERDRMTGELNMQRDAIAAERAQLEQIGTRLAEQFAALDARRVTTERKNAEELERVASARTAFEALRAEQEQRNYEQAASLRESAAMLPVVDDDAAARETEREPEREPEPVSAEEAESPVRDPGGVRGWRRWIIPGAAGALMIALIGGAAAVAYRDRVTAAYHDVVNRVNRPAGVAAKRQPKGGFLSQSSGSVAPALPPFASSGAVPPQAVPPTDTTPKPKPKPKPRPRPVDPVESNVSAAPATVVADSMARIDSVARADSIARADASRRDSASRADSFSRRDSVATDSFARRDSIPRIDSVLRSINAQRDSVLRRDSTGRRDSVLIRDSFPRRDSIARRDSLVRDSLARKRDTLVRPDSIRPPAR
jgi:hypothetical protein